MCVAVQVICYIIYLVAHHALMNEWSTQSLCKVNSCIYYATGFIVSFFYYFVCSIHISFSFFLSFFCLFCFQFHMIMKNLQTTVTSLTSKLKDMNSKQEKCSKPSKSSREKTWCWKMINKKYFKIQKRFKLKTFYLGVNLMNLKSKRHRNK